MLSEEPKKSKSTALGDRVCGSLQSMNLGALLVGQLSQAINWSNDSSFKKPECRPWVELPAVSGGIKNERLNSEATPDPVVEPTSIVKVTESNNADDANVDVNSSAPLEATSVVCEKESIEQAENSELSPPAMELPEEVAREEIVATVQVEIVAKPSEVALAEVALESDTVPDSSIEASAKEIKEVAKPSSVVKTPRQDSIQSKPVEQLTDVEVVSKSANPHKRTSYQVAERMPLARADSRSSRVEAPQDDYLMQLERLVVELNMELARVRGEEATVDPIEQMANRIIALNLENLALREQLQQSNPKS